MTCRVTVEVSDSDSTREYQTAGGQKETTQNPCYNMYMVCPLEAQEKKTKYQTSAEHAGTRLHRSGDRTQPK
jgi:hypothetical protein